MHPHTRRKTKKRLGRLSPRRNPPEHSYAPVTPAVVPEVESEELTHLADDLAYLRARRYREAAPDDVREEDVERAEAEISLLFKREDKV
jgi:hypothetical protein